MRKLRLQVFGNVCARCGARFRTLHQSPHDYGVAVLVSPSERVAAAAPDDDPVWEEVRVLVESIAEGRNMTDRDMAVRFPLAFDRTVDALDGDRLYMWGDIPCPVCGSQERAISEPKEPPEFLDVTADAVTHERWEALSNEEKRRKVIDALQLASDS